MIFHHKIRTRYAETGQDGIIHHSAYIVYLEEARLEYLKILGCDIKDLEQKKIYCPVVDLSLKYVTPLLLFDDINIEVGVEKVSKVRFSFKYTILKGKTLVAKGAISHCFTNEKLKPIGIPEKIKNYLLDNIGE